jgi:hypothetical protein
MYDKSKMKELVPEHMHGGLARYIDSGIMPGSFLSAVLTNDLKGAFGYADHINKNRVGDIAMYLYNYAPSACWGSPSKVEQWVAHGGLNREQT